MRRGIERDGVEISDMADLMGPLSASVLTGHNIAAQINGNSVLAVHAAFLAKGLNGPLPLD